VTVIATAQPSAEPATSTRIPLGYKLVFSDEFSGPRLNTKKWSSGLAWGPTNRQEQQYYTPQALRLASGRLVVTAREQRLHGKSYSSGAINTAKHFEFRYGYVESRIRVPEGQGLWSALWLGSRVRNSHQEIDIMEVLGSDPHRLHVGVHYGSHTDHKQSSQDYRMPDLSAGMHTYAIDWRPDRVVWYIDGVEFRREIVHIPNEPTYLTTNLTVGGATSWSGAPDNSTVFPAQLTVDYIRVYQPG
jgi:beta-glucanase (GH16 family)